MPVYRQVEIKNFEKRVFLKIKFTLKGHLESLPVGRQA